MKKLLVSAVVAMMIVSAATAQITVGAKGIFGIGAGTSLVFPEGTPEESKPDTSVLLGGGGGLYVRYNLPMLSALGFQTELDILAGNGIGIKSESPFGTVEMSVSYTSLELPILVTYDFNVGPVTLTALVGPHLSFPLGKMKLEAKMNDKKIDVSEIGPNDFSIDSKALFGMTFGMAVAYPVGPGSIVGDIRYLNDFSKLRVEGGGAASDMLTRRTLNISLGYQMTF